MNPKQWQAILSRLEGLGFRIHREAPYILRHYAEVYQVAQWTVAIGAKGGDHEADGFRVEIYFDAEALEHRNNVREFGAGEVEAAILYARALVKAQRGDVLAEAYQE